MKRLPIWIVSGTLALVALWGGVLHPCGLESTFRSYLDRRFWQPLAKYEASLGRPASEHKPTAGTPFAGMTPGGAPAVLREAREAYRAGDWGRGRAAVAEATGAGLSDAEREELLLIDAKMDLREGEAGKAALLDRAREKLGRFVASCGEPGLRSEARGWIARVAYLSRDYPTAAKIYLDELADPQTIFSRQSLVASLRYLFPYNGSGVRLADHLEEYFDTPAHALFVVNLVTNPVYDDPEERAAMAGVAKKTIDALERKKDLFGAGADSEALALALVRASLYMGDTARALVYAGSVPEGSATGNMPEFLWMKSACMFLQGRYAEAEAPLLKMSRSKDADRRDRIVASIGLIGVYHKLGRGADQLHAAFLYHAATREKGDPGARGEQSEYLNDPYSDFHYLPVSGWLVDLAYLLDVQLDDGDLALYLKRHGGEARRIRVEVATPRERNAYEMVRYAQAVRLARRERYLDAVALFGGTGARPRAERMTCLAELHGRANDPGLNRAEHLAALYDYAAYLEENSTRVFFNDMLWYGHQRYMLLSDTFEPSEYDSSYPPPVDAQGLTGEERSRFMTRERRLKDEQEERWRAFKIFDALISEAGDSELGKKALTKALRCLELIRTDRFGREDEIAAAKKRLWARAKRG